MKKSMNKLTPYMVEHQLYFPTHIDELDVLPLVKTQMFQIYSFTNWWEQAK